jgi:hypothetical protein
MEHSSHKSYSVRIRDSNVLEYLLNDHRNNENEITMILDWAPEH